jgi:hypothetical protein
MNWPTPKNVIDIICFMDLVGYYRRFTKGFFKIAHPITCKRRVINSNGHRCEEDFKLLKLLTSTLILQIVNPNKIFVVAWMLVENNLVDFLCKIFMWYVLSHES